MGKSEDLEEGKHEILPKIGPANPTRISTKDRNHKVERTTDLSQRIDKSTGERTVAVNGDFTEDFSQLDSQIKSMMEMSKNLVSNGTKRAYICKICGKEGMGNDIRKHIESNHLEGLSFPCNLCGKTSRSRNALGMHKKCIVDINQISRTRDSLRHHKISAHKSL